MRLEFAGPARRSPGAQLGTLPVSAATARRVRAARADAQPRLRQGGTEWALCTSPPVYDLTQRRLIEVQELTDAKKAPEACGRAEMAHLGDRDTEIVLVGSDSIETVKKTHGRDFTAGAVITLPELAAT